jgi:AraC-like DNA-binding protein
MSQPINIELDNFISDDSPNKCLFKNDVVIHEIDRVDTELVQHIHEKPTSRINASSFFLTKQGEMSVNIDYQKYKLYQNMILQISNVHIIDKLYFSRDFKGYILFISQDLFSIIRTEVFSLKSLGFETKLFHPMLRLDKDSTNLLEEIIHRLQKHIKATDHFFQGNLIKNEVSNFLLELADMNIKNDDRTNLKSESSHKEDVLQKFIKLIISHSKEQHLVSFYASELCMTPENLSRIIKSVSGKTVNIWISNALLAEAKILLRKPEMSIQQAAQELNFGNQSSFGKFFKKHTGKTPLEYKNDVLSDKENE